MNPYDNRTSLNVKSKRIINDLIDQANKHHASNLFACDGSKISFKSGSMQVSCLNTHEGITGLIKRLRKGLNSKMGTYQANTSILAARPLFASIIKSFLDDGEQENAYQYAINKNRVNDYLNILEIYPEYNQLAA